MRLDERNQPRSRCGKIERRRKCELERDEAHIGGDELRCFAKMRFRQISGVETLDDSHSGVAADALSKLAVSDIDSDHTPRAPFEQNLREAAGRSADIEGSASGGRPAEVVERMNELERRARDIGAGLIVDLDPCVRLNRMTGSCCRLAGDEDLASQDGTASPRARYIEAVLNQRFIETESGHERLQETAHTGSVLVFR